MLSYQGIPVRREQGRHKVEMAVVQVEAYGVAEVEHTL
jgi:hypothetical protein